MASDDFEEWLLTLPLDEPVEIDDESIYLKVGSAGAELGAYFIHSPVDRQIQEALKQGFQNAIDFDAGFSLSLEEDALLLTQWLPHVADWQGAIGPLEKLLNQLEFLRTFLVVAPPTPREESTQSEQTSRS